MLREVEIASSWWGGQISSGWVKIRLHTENQFASQLRTALQDKNCIIPSCHPNWVEVTLGCDNIGSGELSGLTLGAFSC